MTPDHFRREYEASAKRHGLTCTLGLIDQDAAYGWLVRCEDHPLLRLLMVHQNLELSV